MLTVVISVSGLGGVATMQIPFSDHEKCTKAGMDIEEMHKIQDKELTISTFCILRN